MDMVSATKLIATAKESAKFFPTGILINPNILITKASSNNDQVQIKTVTIQQYVDANEARKREEPTTSKKALEAEAKRSHEAMDQTTDDNMFQLPYAKVSRTYANAKISNAIKNFPYGGDITVTKKPAKSTVEKQNQIVIDE